jgi:hypothetical protein
MRVSEGLQKGEQVRLERPRSSLDQLNPSVLPESLHCFALHLKVSRDIMTDGGTLAWPR